MNRQGSSADTDLNMKILFDMEDTNLNPERIAIVRRFSGFQRAVSHTSTNNGGWGGFLLNMREFIRAMHLGTYQTVRVRDQSTQTENNEVFRHNVTLDGTQFDSQETYFDPSALHFPDPQW